MHCLQNANDLADNHRLRLDSYCAVPISLRLVTERKTTQRNRTDRDNETESREP